MESESVMDRDANAEAVLAKRHGGIRALALVVLVGLVVALGMVAGRAPGAGLATAWEQVTHPPFTPAQRQQITALVTRAAATYTHQITVTVGSPRAVQAIATLGWTAEIRSADVAQEQERVKALCLQVQQALWSSGAAPTDVLVIVLGPVTDGYGETVTAAHGTAELGETTAATFRWSTLTPDGAWNRYDHAYLRPSYNWHVL